jgi:hypothetical protein
LSQSRQIGSVTLWLLRTRLNPCGTLPSTQFAAFDSQRIPKPGSYFFPVLESFIALTAAPTATPVRRPVSASRS